MHRDKKIKNSLRGRWDRESWYFIFSLTQWTTDKQSYNTINILLFWWFNVFQTMSKDALICNCWLRREKVNWEVPDSFASVHLLLVYKLSKHCFTQWFVSSLLCHVWTWCICPSSFAKKVFDIDWNILANVFDFYESKSAEHRRDVCYLLSVIWNYAKQQYFLAWLICWESIDLNNIIMIPQVSRN